MPKTNNQFGSVRELGLDKKSPIHSSDLLPGVIKQRHIDGLIIFRGDSTDRPSDGGTQIQAYFANDTSALSIWNETNEAWESTTLS